MSFNRVVECNINGVLIKDLKIDFEITKTLAKSTNACKISIYNLRDETTKKIALKDVPVILKAGYEDEGGSKNIFFGSVLTFKDIKEGVNRIFEITALDGIKELKTKTFSKGYIAGVKIKQVVDDLTSAIGLPVRNIKTLPDLAYTNAFGYTGYALNGLAIVLAYAKRTYSIQNNELILLADGETYISTGLLISENTGLLGSPYEIGDSSKDEIDTSPQRWGFKCLLYPDLIPGGLVSLQSKKVQGSFKIESVIFTGSNFEDDFNAQCEVKVL